MSKKKWILIVMCMGFAIAASAVSFATTINYSGYNGFSSISYYSQFHGYQTIVDRDYTEGQMAYDYASHVLHTGEDTGYRKRHFWLGRWRQSQYGYDGDHILQNTSGDGGPNSWSMFYGHPDVYVGWEEGGYGYWWQGNIGDPEVAYNPATQVWVMLAQRQIDYGQVLDYGGYAASSSCDRIQYLSSGNCAYPWWKYTSRGVVTNLTDPTHTALHHPELVYVPDDEDGKWWLYVGVLINGADQGHYRMKSDDPMTFDWGDREYTWMPQWGNQIGYLDTCPGGRLFVRITHVSNGAGREVPTIMISRNGLTWDYGTNGPVLLAGSTDNYLHRNCYFLGISTINGQGPLYDFGGGHYQALYAATTCNSPNYPDIMNSEIGSGQVDIYVNQ